MMEARPLTPLFAEFPPVSREEWEAAIRKDLKGADYDKKLIHETLDGIRIRPYYRSDDVAALARQSEALAALLPRRERTAPWEICQEIATPSPEEAVALAAAATERGAHSVAVCWQTQPRATDATGLLRATQRLLDRLLPAPFPLHLRLGVNAKAAAALLLSSPAVLGQGAGGTLDFDPLAAGARLGAPTSDEALQEDLCSIVRAFRQQAPHWRPLAVGVEYVHRAGGTLTQELAVALATALDYIALLAGAGVSYDDIIASIYFSCETGSDYFAEIARLRALRLLVARLLEPFAPAGNARLAAPLHAASSRYNLSLLDKHVNILRATTEAMAAALGGCDVIRVAAFDERWGAPGELAFRLARNTQIILQEEAYLGKVIDPAAGAYYLEWLTDALAREAWRLFQEIESQGGIRPALASGWLQQQIAAVRMKRDSRLAARKDILVGVNSYPALEEEILPPQEAGDASVPAALPAVCLRPEVSLSALQRAINSGEELPTCFIATSSLPPSFPPLASVEVPAAAPFEQLRLAMERHRRLTGTSPAAFLLTHGDVSWRNARAMFVRNLLGCAGFRILENTHPNDLAAGLSEGLRTGAQLLVLCSADAEYPALAAAVAESFKRAQPAGVLIVAGYPQESLAELRALGVDEFVHLRINALEMLRNLQQRVGVPAWEVQL